MTRGVRIFAALVTASLFAVPFAVWAWSTGNPLYYLWHDVPPGQEFYVVSRLAGLLALSLFWLQAMAMLLRGLPGMDGWMRFRPVTHRRLGMLLFALILLHCLCFFVAVSVRSGHMAFGLFIPVLDGGFYKFHIGLGVIALGLIVAVVAAGFLRYRMPWLRWLHRTWVVVFALVLLHGLNVGTETRVGLMDYVYLFMAFSLAIAVVLRVRAALSRIAPLSDSRDRNSEGRQHA